MQLLFSLPHTRILHLLNGHRYLTFSIYLENDVREGHFLFPLFILDLRNKIQVKVRKAYKVKFYMAREPSKGHEDPEKWEKLE